MTVDTNRLDIIVQTFYFSDKNPNYKGANKILIEKEPIYRYNFNHSKMAVSYTHLLSVILPFQL